MKTQMKGKGMIKNIQIPCNGTSFETLHKPCISNDPMKGLNIVLYLVFLHEHIC